MASGLQSTVLDFMVMILHWDSSFVTDFLRFYGVLQNAVGCLHMMIIDHKLIAYNI
jgi:hypothetical protein